MLIKKLKRFIQEYPSHTILLSLLVTIVCGALLLMLPICQNIAMDMIDVFFIATSLTTVTGMTTVPFEHFTTIGQCIMLILMQIGGLGLMTMSLFIMSLFVDFGLYTQLLATEVLSIQSFKDTKRILFFVIKFTFACELLGAIATFLVIKNDYSSHRAIFLSIFHAVGSFCNVGISLFNNGTCAYNTNCLMLITTTLLFLFGSLGFVTWHEFFNLFKKWRRNETHRLSWHTMIILKLFFATTAITATLFWLLEKNNSLVEMTFVQQFLNVLLIGISTKSAGYLTLNLTAMLPAVVLLFAMTAFIGAAPCSTGGGIKLGAFAVFLSIIRATIRGKTQAEISLRCIAQDQVYKATAIISLACLWIIFITFCLLITEHNSDFLAIFLETISAFANNGISLGMTKLLTIYGKLLIIATMITGRIGALALILGMRRSSDTVDFSYPEERVILG